MTLAELSVEYRAHAHALDLRICQLEYLLEHTKNADRRCQLQDRIRMLSAMLREARELAVLTERYYDRGTAGMPNTRYRKGKLYAADMAMYSRQIQADNSREISRLKRNLIRCLREDITSKQREMILMYYAEGKNMREIGESMGINKSTVSRTIKRGERRLQRCLRYGAESYLRNMDDL